MKKAYEQTLWIIQQLPEYESGLAPRAAKPLYLHIPISGAQAEAMRAAIANRTANPGHYNLIFNNCAGFVESVLHAGGVSGVPHAEVSGPAVLGAVLWYENTWR
jgi:hypothetical protein